MFLSLYKDHQILETKKKTKLKEKEKTLFIWIQFIMDGNNAFYFLAF
jgi:hypothetical protein